MNPSHVAAGALVVALAVVGVAAYAVLGGGGGAAGDGRLDVASVEVALNDDLSGDLEGVESGSANCAGPPPDSFVVRVRGTVDDPESGEETDTDSYDLTVGIGEETATRRIRVTDGGSEEVRAIVVVPDDESVDPGDRATVRVSLVHEGETVDSTTRSATATPRDMDCENTGGRVGRVGR